MMKRYKNFNQIDQELKILKLEKRISQEKIKLGVRHLRDDLKPSHMLMGLLGKIVKEVPSLKETGIFDGMNKKKNRKENGSGRN